MMIETFPMEAIVTGTLLRQEVPGQRGEGKAVHEERGPGGLRLYRLQLAVHEATGQVKMVPVTIEGDLRGLIPQAELRVGNRLMVRGYLARTLHRDLRYATPRYPDGYAYQAPGLVVQQIIRASEDDSDETYVRVQGTITDLPRIQPHPTERSLEIASTQIDVAMPLRDRRGRETYITGRVPVYWPTRLNDAEVGLRQGNTVAVVGWIDIGMRPVPQRNGIIRVALEAQEAQWQADQEHVKPTDRHDQPLPEHILQRKRERVGSRIAQERHALLHVPVVRIRGGSLELVDGQPLALDEARALDAERLEHKTSGAPGGGTGTEPAHSTGTGEERQRPRRKAAAPADDAASEPVTTAANGGNGVVAEEAL
jgi:hypothetical protein